METYFPQLWRLEAQDQGASRSSPREGSLPGLNLAIFLLSRVAENMITHMHKVSGVSSHRGTNPVIRTLFGSKFELDVFSHELIILFN